MVFFLVVRKNQQQIHFSSIIFFAAAKQIFTRTSIAERRRMSSENKSNYGIDDAQSEELLIMAFFDLPSATKPELAASRPTATYRWGTEGICRCRAREHECVQGASLRVASRVAARRHRRTLDWHSSF